MAQGSCTWSENVRYNILNWSDLTSSSDTIISGKNKIILNHLVLVSGHIPSEADLRVDKENHGTMVASIIEINGPNVMKFVNMKVSNT